MKKKTCLVCKKAFKVKPYRENIAKYCSQECYLFYGQKGKKPWNFGLKTGIIPRTAFKKGEHFSSKTEFKKGGIPIHRFPKGHIPWNKGKEFYKIRGSNHPQWRGGITPMNVKIRNSILYKMWRTNVFKRDNYTCQKCGQWGGKLNADHIKDFAYYPELRFELSNGRTLCVSCHKLKGTYKGKNYERTFVNA